MVLLQSKNGLFVIVHLYKLKILGLADNDSLIFCNFMADGSWVLQDGYYYYTEALVPGDLTTALFDTVIFSPNMGNEFKNCSIQFILVCQSVQTNGNSDDPLAAWGWPDEPNVSTN